MMNIKEYYMNKYPQDELGVELNENATFTGLVTHLFGDMDVYNYIGVGDSLVRERLFEELAKQLNKPYDYVYQLWLS
jgi:hypothetical protein